MRRTFSLAAVLVPLAAFLAVGLSGAPEGPRREDPNPGLVVQTGEKVVLAVHGGAGVLSPREMTPALRMSYKRDLEKALKEGHDALKKGTSLDAVVAAIKVLEDSPRFNAGRGAVFTHDGRHELDASIMEGEKKLAGAVAGVSIVKNPITAARAVMEHSPHVLLTGRGAEEFARERGLDIVRPSWFSTEGRRRQLHKALEEEAKKKEKKGPKGTVGAVAVGKKSLAAGTSTGGMTNKRWGRVGDSPIIGAGTYADNASCAVSCTGHGEVFIRFAAAHDVAARMKYQRASAKEAAREVLAGMPEEDGGVGGLIVLTPRGDLAAAYNTEGMYRGYVTENGATRVFIYKDELTDR